MSTKQKNNGSNRIVELARNNSVPLMFILICAVCIPISGFSPGYLLNEQKEFSLFQPGVYTCKFYFYVSGRPIFYLYANQLSLIHI